MRTLGNIAALTALALSGGVVSYVPPAPQRREDRFYLLPHQGVQEMERRRNQIACGQLRRENGLFDKAIAAAPEATP